MVMKLLSKRHKAQCDGSSCGDKHKRGIEGPRLHCQECPDCDLCLECYNRGDHRHTFQYIEKPGSKPLLLPGSKGPLQAALHTVKCDGVCGMSLIRGPRFHCRTCEDYDLCLACYKKRIHSKHGFHRIDRPGGPAQFLPALDSGIAAVATEQASAVTPAAAVKMTPVVSIAPSHVVSVARGAGSAPTAAAATITATRAASPRVVHATHAVQARATIPVGAAAVVSRTNQPQVQRVSFHKPEGTALGMLMEQNGAGDVYVSFLKKGGLCEMASIRVGDVLVGINSTPCVNMELATVIATLRKLTGDVSLLIRREENQAFVPGGGAGQAYTTVSSDDNSTIESEVAAFNANHNLHRTTTPTLTATTSTTFHRGSPPFVALAPPTRLAASPTRMANPPLRTTDSPIRMSTPPARPPSSSNNHTTTNGGVYACDVCKVQPIPGPRLHCQTCEDFDMCLSCYNKGEHRMHGFLQLDGTS